jgi:hypothetical protein
MDWTWVRGRVLKRLSSPGRPGCCILQITCNAMSIFSFQIQRKKASLEADKTKIIDRLYSVIGRIQYFTCHLGENFRKDNFCTWKPNTSEWIVMSLQSVWCVCCIVATDQVTFDK